MNSAYIRHFHIKRLDWKCDDNTISTNYSAPLSLANGHRSGTCTLLDFNTNNYSQFARNYQADPQQSNPPCETSGVVPEKETHKFSSWILEPPHPRREAFSCQSPWFGSQCAENPFTIKYIYIYTLL